MSVFCLYDVDCIGLTWTSHYYHAASLRHIYEQKQTAFPVMDEGLDGYQAVKVNGYTLRPPVAVAKAGRPKKKRRRGRVDTLNEYVVAGRERPHAS